MTDAPLTRLMLVTPVLEEVAAFEPMLAAALKAGDVAAVAIRLAPADDRTLLERAKPLVRLVQEAEAAALLAGEHVADIVGKSGADGVQLDGEREGFDDLVGRFKPEKIVGAAIDHSRDAAMSAGEAGADYVLFGDDVGGRPFAETLERVAWWVPIFETPCVGVAQAIEDVSALAAENVEFAALGDAVWKHPDGPAAAVAAAEAMLSLARTPTP